MCVKVPAVPRLLRNLSSWRKWTLRHVNFVEIHRDKYDLTYGLRSIPCCSHLAFAMREWVWVASTHYRGAETVADPGGPGGPAPLAPKIFSKSCSFEAILREKPLFWANFGLRAPGVKTLLGPLTKILDPRLWKKATRGGLVLLNCTIHSFTEYCFLYIFCPIKRTFSSNSERQEDLQLGISHFRRIVSEHHNRRKSHLAGVSGSCLLYADFLANVFSSSLKRKGSYGHLYQKQLTKSHSFSVLWSSDQKPSLICISPLCQTNDWSFAKVPWSCQTPWFPNGCTRRFSSLKSETYYSFQKILATFTDGWCQNRGFRHKRWCGTAIGWATSGRWENLHLGTDFTPTGFWCSR